ncbi:hypothetical protein ACN20G_23325 [Streptomyces sp. BI20]|uniref:hypothetical protein n=1 Tax=Streptomyces sp. BI20 TaxID=3403460 RepID=UPI003C791FB6
MASYDYADVSKAVNAGADLVLDELDGSEHNDDLVSLVVNAIMARLDNPEISFDEMIRQNYGEEPEEVRGWWGW